MATDENKRAGCFRWGCLSCLGCVGILLLIFGAVALFGFLASRGGGGPVEREEQSQSLPAPRPLTDVGEGGSEGAAFAPPPGEIGVVDLDFSMGRLDIVPAPAGEPIRVEAEYEVDAYELETSFEPPEEGRGWVYRLRFEKKSGFGFLIRNNDSSNNVTLHLPRDTPMALRGVSGAGMGRFELGGLWLTDVDLSIGTGNYTIRFDEPTREPLQRFAIDGATGMLRLEKVGNASPAEVDVNHNIGDFWLDLHGAWRGDSNVRVRCRIGTCGVHVPDDASVVVSRADATIGEVRGRVPHPPGPDEIDRPTLVLDASVWLGELSIDD